MSKSYRYDPDEGGYSNRPSWERTLQDEWDCGTPPEREEGQTVRRRRNPKRGEEQPAPAPMTPEWAMELMRKRVESVVGNLAARGIIAGHECEDYVQILNIHICQILPQYDAERVGADGRKASVRRFLSVSIDNAVANIKMRIARLRQNLPIFPMQDYLDDGGDDGASDVLSDGCRDVSQLCLCMDVRTLLGMLSAEGRLALTLRFAGFSFNEIADEMRSRLGITADRFHVMNVTMEAVRREARKCGFIPPSELRPAKEGGGANEDLQN